MKTKLLLPAALFIVFSFNMISAQVLNMPVTKKVVDITFSPDGQYIAVCLETNTKEEIVYLWDKLGGLVKTYKSKESELFQINCLSISPDNKYIIAGGLLDKYGMILMWDMESGQSIY